MSRLVFDDSDPDNRPVLIDPTTGKLATDDSPVMKAVIQVWEKQTTLAERRAWHAVTCLNSREPADMRAVAWLNHKFQMAIEALN